MQLSLTGRGQEVTGHAVTIVQQLLDQLLEPLGGLNGQRTGAFSRELAVLRALGAILDRLLARTGTSFPQWTVLAVTAASGGTAGRDHLVGAIADGRIPEQAVLTGIAELTAAQLLEVGPEQHVRLAEAGQARYREIRAAIEEITSRAFDFPAADLATAGLVHGCPGRPSQRQNHLRLPAPLRPATTASGARPDHPGALRA